MYAFTILGFKRDDMSEDEYHNYISTVHSAHLKALLAQNDIVSYTMQHNTSQTRDDLINKVYQGQMPAEKVFDCDAIIQVVFKTVEDYLRVREDPHFQTVVNPDHVNFAHPTKTRFVMGWHEVHVADGKVVS
ncbi:hypothetical protein N7493_007377 [Penicillium malachiteum]|uniref:EthD domain-containing protein n=1 Tax=Penicillium malachiteum TaxID=1324776 RepID=A0AAD6MUY9_9EURO|nr:hypothetical protein N7493_007377 [Penicillium malachiteum]